MTVHEQLEHELYRLAHDCQREVLIIETDGRERYGFALTLIGPNAILFSQRFGTIPVCFDTVLN